MGADLLTYRHIGAPDQNKILTAAKMMDELIKADGREKENVKPALRQFG